MGTRLEGRGKHYLGISKHSLVSRLRSSEIGIGAPSISLGDPSHTTGHTGPYHGGSTG